MNIISTICDDSLVVFDERKIYTEEDMVSKSSSFPFANPYFGVLHLNTKSFPEISAVTKKKVFNLVITSDVSSSMNYPTGAKGQIKLEQLIRTLKGIVGYEFLWEYNIVLTLFTFHHEFQTIALLQKLSGENMQELLQKIQTIQAYGSTNIELALKETKKFFEKRMSEFPDEQFAHIFMTDGETTDGETNADILKELCCQNVPNFFVGFGEDHNAQLLRTLASVSESNQTFFIDDSQNAGLVYGEMLHAILHVAVRDAQLFSMLPSTLLYNWKTNQWVHQLSLADLVLSTEKNFHILSDNPQNVQLHLTAGDQSADISKVLVITSESTFLNDPKYAAVTTSSAIDKFKFRQCTLELLYRVANRPKPIPVISWKNKKNTSLLLYNNNNNNNMDNAMLELDAIAAAAAATTNPVAVATDVEETLLPKEMADLSDKIRKYIVDEETSIDAKCRLFLQLLINDLAVCQATFHHFHGRKYALSRQTTQSAQRAFTIGTNLPLPPDPSCGFMRGPQTCSMSPAGRGGMFKFPMLDNVGGGRASSHPPITEDLHCIDYMSSPYATEFQQEMMTKLSQEENVTKSMDL